MFLLLVFLSLGSSLSTVMPSVARVDTLYGGWTRAFGHIA